MSVNTTGFTAGTLPHGDGHGYRCHRVAEDGGGDAHGQPATPVLAVTPASMTFNATAGGANPAAQNITVSNTGGGTLNWTATDNQDVAERRARERYGGGHAGGVGEHRGLAAGTYTGTVTVTATGASACRRPWRSRST